MAKLQIPEKNKYVEQYWINWKVGFDSVSSGTVPENILQYHAERNRNLEDLWNAESVLFCDIQ
jgi:hypothetical protein